MPADRRPISYETARAQFMNRYTMEHIPDWAKRRCDNGKYYAPQYATDRQWYDSTLFYGEKGAMGITTPDSCHSSGETWPLGLWLGAPMKTPVVSSNRDSGELPPGYTLELRFGAGGTLAGVQVFNSDDGFVGDAPTAESAFRLAWADFEYNRERG